MKFILFFLLLLSCAHNPQAPSFDQKLSQYEYPYPIKTFHFTSQGQKLQMTYMDIGANNSKVFVLMHGKNFNGAYFDKTARFLKNHNYRVIIIDQIGFGKSSKPLHYQYSFHALARNTHDLLQSLNIKTYHLLGHSMGGMLATRYALMYPKEVKKLFLLNPIGLEDWKLVVPYRSIDENYKAALKTTNEDLRQYQVKSYYDNKWKDEYEKWLSPLIGWNSGADREHMAMINALTTDMVFTQPVIYEFPKLQTPTILMIGDRDRTAIGKNLVAKEVAAQMGHYDKLAYKIQKMIPRSKLILFKNIGHLPHIESFQKFRQKLQAEI